MNPTSLDSLKYVHEIEITENGKKKKKRRKK